MGQVQDGLKDATRLLASGVAEIGLELSATKSQVLATYDYHLFLAKFSYRTSQYWQRLTLPNFF